MQLWIALFRGINVGGNNLLPMTELRAELESLGLKNVRTYIQSGNCMFESSHKSSAALVKKIGDLVESNHGFRPQVMLLTKSQLQAAIDQNPFPEAIQEPTTLHFYFLAKPATQANLAALDKAKLATESYRLTDGVFYLHTPDGLSKSKLAVSAEKLLGVFATARNYRTVEKLAVG